MMSYQKVTGPLMANSHPGSYCGQDAYNGMLVVDDEMCCERSAASGSTIGHSRGVELYARSANFSRGGGDEMNDEKTVVRRLTPLECERLQGFPDEWTLIGEWDEEKQERFYIGTDGKRKKVTDSARYKALGNSICTPFWFWLLRRIAATYERPATLGSLFDGISGFPYVWARCNGAKYCLWSSEVEEFPIAVCKQHFGDEETGQKGDIWTYMD